MRTRVARVASLAAPLWTLISSVSHAHPTQAAVGMFTDPDTAANAITYHGAGTAPASLTIYLIWYEATGHTWTTAQKSLLRLFFSSIQASSWWQVLNRYGDGVPKARTMALFGTECTDPETEGTSISNGSTTIRDNNLTPSGCALPNDANGLYFVLPSYHDITVSGGALGYHASTMAMTTRQAFPIVSPNGDPYFDGLIYIVSHELAEAISNPANGWFGGISTEIADACPGIGHLFTTPTGAMGDLATTTAGTTTYWYVNELWLPTNGGGCAMGPNDVTIGCRTVSDCQSGACLGGKCSAVAAAPNLFASADGLLNGRESDLDCGGNSGTSSTNSVPRCANGKAGVFGGDCTSGASIDGACCAATITGSTCCAYQPGAFCSDSTDCCSGTCTSNACACLPAGFPNYAGDSGAFACCSGVSVGGTCT